MTISDIDAFLLSYVFPEPLKLPFWGGERTIFKRDAMVVRVATENGLVGYAPGPAHERAEREIRDVITPFLLGRDPRKWQEFHFDADLHTVKTYRAVEFALIDLAAKAEGAPASELIGGQRRDRVKLYGSAGMYMSPEAYAEEAAAVASLGFPAYKMRPASGPEKDLETVEKMRSATGSGFGLMVDAHAWWRMGDKSYSYETVEKLAREMARYNLTWLEEPLPPDDHGAYRRLREAGHVPVASGEHEQDEASFIDLINLGAVDYVQMDVCCQGGFEMAQRIFEAAAAQGLRFAFHSWGTMLEVMAAAQLAVCWDENPVEWLEFPCYANGGKPGMYAFPLAEELLAEPLRIEDGYLVVPDKPGLGVEVDERVFERYPYRPGPWSLFRTDSPPETHAVTGDHSVKWVEAERP